MPYYPFEVAELCNMCVDAQHRGEGIGKKLTEKFFQHYQQIGIKHFVVTASFKNESAKAFYKKEGFVEINSTFAKFEEEQK